MKTILDTKLEPIVDKIDDRFPGFYVLFDRNEPIKFRIANFILGDELRPIIGSCNALNHDLNKHDLNDHGLSDRDILSIAKIYNKHIQRHIKYIFEASASD